MTGAPRKIRFGLHLGSITPLAREPFHFVDRVSEVASAADDAGFDALFVPDHVLQNDIGGGRTAPMLEAYTLLGALATCTARVSLGTLVSAVTFRNPALLAKCVTTLDVLSHGRAILGIGAGWDEEEHQAYGISFPPLGQRMDRLGEALAICRAMFTEETPTSVGSHYAINGAFNVPRPLNGDIPIMIGGGGERRTLRFVAAFADIWNCPGDPPTLRQKFGVLEAHCETIGRDPANIAKTCLLMPPASVDDLLFSAESHLAVEGVDGLVVVIDQPDVSTIHAWGRVLTETFS